MLLHSTVQLLPGFVPSCLEDTVSEASSVPSGAQNNFNMQGSTPGVHRHPDAIDAAAEAFLPGQMLAICSVGELFGGVERHILGILSGLRTHGINSLLFLFHEGELAVQARAQGHEPIILPAENKSLLATSRQLACLLKRQRVQIVHVHGYKATIFCALARYWHPFALVKTEHGLPEPIADSSAQALRSRLYHFLADTATRWCGATICYVTKDLRTHYQRAHRGLRTIVIPNGVAMMDPNQFSRPIELHPDRFNLAIVGRLDTVKGHDLAIEAMAAEDLPSDVHLHIVGTGPRETQLRTLAEERRVATRVHFLGFRRNIYDYLTYCQALLMPSLHEGLPYTLLETMALGTPIIASRVGGLSEVLEHGATALLIPPGDALSLAQAIMQLRNDTLLCRQLGDNAQRVQRTRYSLETMTKSYLAAYQQLLTNEADG